MPARQRTLAWNPSSWRAAFLCKQTGRSQVFLCARPHPGVEYSTPDWRVSGVEGIEHCLARTGAHEQRGPPATAR